MNKHVEGLKLVVPRSVDTSYIHHSILAANETDSMNLAQSYYDRKDRSSQIDCLNSMMGGLLILESILPMLEGCMRRISKLRNPVTSNLQTRQEALRRLEDLERYILHGIDIAAVIYEIDEHSGEEVPLLDPAEFELQSFKSNDHSVTLVDNLYSTVRYRVNWFKTIGPQFREHMTQYGAMLGNKENVALQKKIVCLTYVLVGLAVVTLLSSALPYSSLLMKIASYLP